MLRSVTEPTKSTKMTKPILASFLLLLSSGLGTPASAGVVTSTQPRPTPPVIVPGHADPSSPADAGVAYPVGSIYDQHAYNRALALGAVLIANGGIDVHTWKDINPNQLCWSSGSTSSTGTVSRHAAAAAPNGSDAGRVGGPTGPAQPVGRTTPVDPLLCWNTMVTLSYSLAECPDGRAFLLRQGVGVTFTDVATGTLVNWQEVANCDGGPTPLLTGFDPQDKHRPLDLQHMIIEER